MKRLIIAAAPLALLVACGLNGTDSNGEEQTTQTADNNLADAMASDDAAHALQGPDPRPVMQLQVVLDRLGFGPGVIDGQQNASTTSAIAGFQEASGLPITGELDTATESALAQYMRIPSTREVTIPADWAQTPYAPVPEGAEEQAQMTQMGYESIGERLAERFHTSVAALQALNAAPSAPAPSGAAPTGTAAPGTAAAAPVAFQPGQKILVPNIGNDAIERGAIDNADWQVTLASLGIGSSQPDAARIVVDKSEGWLKAYDAQDRLIAKYTVTTGSRHDPLPLGAWGIKGKAYNPPYSFDPALLRGVPDSAGKQQLPPGPNSPVGVVWIDLTKDHYGIHGTPSPETIGTAESNGCVRLTNWDAARLAEMVSGSTKVLFQA
jgi:lipoprotein-anchoring transpeptidase ErfK/SrfK